LGRGIDRPLGKAANGVTLLRAKRYFFVIGLETTMSTLHEGMYSALINFIFSFFRLFELFKLFPGAIYYYLLLLLEFLLVFFDILGMRLVHFLPDVVSSVVGTLVPKMSAK
jgi:hypothetical protein